LKEEIKRKRKLPPTKVNSRDSRRVTIGGPGPVPTDIRLACNAQALDGQVLTMRGRHRPHQQAGGFEVLISGGGKNRERLSIRMTPMIDIVFLLIVFFMCVSEMSRLEIEALTLPEASQARDVPDDRPRLTVNVMPGGHYKVNGKRYTLKALRLLMARFANAGRPDQEGNSDLAVRVRADAGVAYKHVQWVLAECRRAKIWQLSFGVAPRRKS
jgi:biopolymer transport protein ExbD